MSVEVSASSAVGTEENAKDEDELTSENLQANPNEEPKDRDDALSDQNVEVSAEHEGDEDLNKAEQLNAKPSRELKLLLELSKEANLDTNISYKRKSFEPGKTMEKPVKSSPATPISVSREEPGKRSMRSQNPDFLLKHKYMSRFLTDAEGAENADKNPGDAPNKPQRKKKESLGETFTGGAIDEKTRKLLKPVLAMVQNDKDGFCWRCHRDKVNVFCGTCSRSYHNKCLKQSAANVERWVCPECIAILTVESTKTRPPYLKDMKLEQLCTLLKFALKRMMQCTDAEPFIHPVNTVEFPDYKKYIVQAMDLTKMGKNIKDNLYGSTTAFEADVKWMLHNSIIFNSYQSKLTTVAKTIIKVCKQEMQEIENCSCCYLNANTKKDWFVEVCPKPHILLWAKLKGFPYWPAKAMSTNSQGMVDVRFFGAHDRAWVPYKECFLFSQKDPNCNKQKRNDINECIKEVDVHIENLKKVYGQFQYAPYRTPFDPEMETSQLQVLLPGYKSDMKSPGKVKNGYQDEPNTSDSGLENKGKEDLNGSLTSESATSKTGSESENSLYVSKVNDLSKEMEGYGTDEESGPMMYRRSCVSEISDEDDEEITRRRSHSKLSGKISAVMKAKTPDTFKRTSSEEVSVYPRKISRRHSIHNTRYSTLNVVESMEISPEDISKKKPSEACRERAKTPGGGKCKIAERLMRRLTESDDPAETAKEDQTETAKEKASDKENVIHINQVVVGEDPRPKTPGGKSNVVQSDDDSANNKSAEACLKVFEGENICDDLLEEMYSEDVNEKEEEANAELLRQKKKKRKRSSEHNKSGAAEELKNAPIQKKLIKLVDINVIKKSLCDKMGPESVEETILEKHLKKLSADEECVIKSEPNSEEEEEEEISDSNYMEAKRLYLSALNISEKAPPKTSAKGMKFKIVDNVSKVIDTVASSYSEEHDGEEILLKEDRARLAQKQRARKSFPKPTVSIKHIISPPPSSAAPSKIPGAVKEPQKINNVLFLTTQAHTGINNITVLPPNQTIAYSGGLTNPILTMVQHPGGGSSFANILVPTPNVNVTSTSQNYIPQRDPKDMHAPGTTNEPAVSGNSAENMPNLVNAAAGNSEAPVSTTTTGNSGPSFTLLNGQSLVQNMPSLSRQVTTGAAPPTDTIDDVNFLNGIVPENITKAITDLMCRAPPKLKPRPPGPLSANFDPGVPSSAGPVTSFVNSVSHRLTDYFRGMLVETLQDMGKTENPQADVACLKLEIEALKHKHSEELLEVKKNVNSILRDIQKSILEEKERLIDETRTACESESIKRVEEAKAKQWCANCMKEAQFYCCWNTSYCDYPCQLKHWPKHMTKCAQNSGVTSQTLSSNNNNNNNNNNGSPKTQVQPLILRKTTIPKTFPGKTVVASKPGNVIVSKSLGTKVSVGAVVKTSSGGTLTIVEPTPGSYELVGNGPISVGGKIINTTVLNKIKPGNIITVTSSANPSLSSVGGIPASQKFIVTQTKTSTCAAKPAAAPEEQK